MNNKLLITGRTLTHQGGIIPFSRMNESLSQLVDSLIKETKSFSGGEVYAPSIAFDQEKVYINFAKEKNVTKELDNSESALKIKELLAEISSEIEKLKNN